MRKNELTPMVLNMGLTHFDLEASIYSISIFNNNMSHGCFIEGCFSMFMLSKKGNPIKWNSKASVKIEGAKGIFRSSLSPPYIVFPLLFVPILKLILQTNLLLFFCASVYIHIDIIYVICIWRSVRQTNITRIYIT